MQLLTTTPHTHTHTHTHAHTQIWLFGYELADTLTAFCANEIHILSSRKKIEFLRPLEGALAKREDLPNLVLSVRNKVHLFSATPDNHFATGDLHLITYVG